jgi:hypothetical protein
MTAARKEILDLLEEMSQRYPEWRFGQLIANVAMWAKQPTDPQDSGIWEVQDEEMLAAMKRNLARQEPAQSQAS